MEVLVAGVKHPAALPSHGHAQGAHQRDVEERYLAAVAVPLLNDILRYAGYGAVFARAGPGIAAHYVVIDQFALLEGIGLLADDGASERVEAHDVRGFKGGVSLVQVAFGVVGQHVAEYPLWREVFAMVDKCGDVLKVRGVARRGRGRFKVS